MDWTLTLALVAGGCLVSVAYALVLRSTWRSVEAARLMAAGRYTEAKTAAERLGRSPMGLFPSVRQAARYTIGCALHLQGDLDASLAALGPLHAAKLRPALRYALCSLDASSLVLLDRDPARAEALLDEAAQIRRPPEDLLLGAFVKRALGHTDEAASLFAAAGLRRDPSKQTDSAIFDERRHQEAIFHTLRGLYLVAIGDRAAAEADLVIAAKSPLSNVYVARARALLALEDHDDGPSSLAPHSVAPRSA